MDPITIHGELLVPTSLLYRLGSPQAVETCLAGAGMLPPGARVERWRQEPIRAAYVLEFVYELTLATKEPPHAAS